MNKPFAIETLRVIANWSTEEESMSVLFTPIKVGKLEIENRFMRSATYSALADEDGLIGDESVELMKRLASNDVGLIITGYAYVLKNGQSFADMNGIQDDDHIPGYQKMTKAVHELGGKIVMQIVHCGVSSPTVASTGGDLMAVSVPEKAAGQGAQPREMTDEDIESIIGAFGQGARRAQEAGFDGVQIHGAHGYLVTQFLSPQSNRRSDKWGGSIENRMRFVVESTRSIKKNVDDDFPVMIKLGCRDYTEADAKLTIEEGAQVAKALEKEGHCHIEISHGMVDNTGRKLASGVTKPEQEAYMLPDARALRAAVDIPLGLVGGIRSPAVMEEIIDSGAADMISICRPLIREPDLVKQWKEGSRKTADCISCGKCFNMVEGKMAICCSQIR